MIILSIIQGFPQQTFKQTNMYKFIISSQAGYIGPQCLGIKTCHPFRHQYVARTLHVSILVKFKFTGKNSQSALPVMYYIQNNKLFQNKILHSILLSSVTLFDTRTLENSYMLDSRVQCKQTTR